MSEDIIISLDYDTSASVSASVSWFLKVRFVVMGNVFCSQLRIHRRYDLKGSSLGRSANKLEIDETTILKDLDLDFTFHMEPSWRRCLLK